MILLVTIWLLILLFPFCTYLVIFVFLHIIYLFSSTLVIPFPFYSFHMLLSFFIYIMFVPFTVLFLGYCCICPYLSALLIVSIFQLVLALLLALLLFSCLLEPFPFRFSRPSFHISLFLLLPFGFLDVELCTFHMISLEFCNESIKLVWFHIQISAQTLPFHLVDFLFPQKLRRAKA